MYFRSYNTSQEAFEDLYDEIISFGEDRSGTKTIYNVGLLIKNPEDNLINTSWRKWNPEYAEYEWQWYLSGNKSAIDISKKAKIWLNMMDENGDVNSNYGYHWQRNNQLDKVVELLKKDCNTRKASISLYDGKEIDLYSKDTVCTYAINFFIKNNKLCMQVMMRSNDLVYGFCNDQYCFSKLQQLVANKLNKKLGDYFHFTCNMHIYQKHFNIKTKNT